MQFSCFCRKNCKLQLRTDASNLAIGAELPKKINGVEALIFFANRFLKNSERNYCTTDKEILTITWALKKFR